MLFPYCKDFSHVLLMGAECSSQKSYCWVMSECRGIVRDKRTQDYFQLKG